MLHGRLNKWLEPSENDRVLQNGFPPANLTISAIVDRRGLMVDTAERNPGCSRPGRARVDSISHTDMKIVGHGYMLVVATPHSREA